MMRVSKPKVRSLRDVPELMELPEDPKLPFQRWGGNEFKDERRQRLLEFLLPIKFDHVVVMTKVIQKA
jgi:hypothetical protein